MEQKNERAKEREYDEYDNNDSIHKLLPFLFPNIETCKNKKISEIGSNYPSSEFPYCDDLWDESVYSNDGWRRVSHHRMSFKGARWNGVMNKYSYVLNANTLESDEFGNIYSINSDNPVFYIKLVSPISYYVHVDEDHPDEYEKIVICKFKYTLGLRENKMWSDFFEHMSWTKDFIYDSMNPFLVRNVTATAKILSNRRYKEMGIKQPKFSVQDGMDIARVKAERKANKKLNHVVKRFALNRWIHLLIACDRFCGKSELAIKGSNNYIKNIRDKNDANKDTDTTM